MTETAFATTPDGRPILPATWSRVDRHDDDPRGLLGFPCWARLYQPMLNPQGEIIGHWFEAGARSSTLGLPGIVGTRQQAANADRVFVVDTLACLVEARRRAPFVPRLAIRPWTSGGDLTGGVLDMLALRQDARVELRFASLPFANVVARELLKRVASVQVVVELAAPPEAA